MLLTLNVRARNLGPQKKINGPLGDLVIEAHASDWFMLLVSALKAGVQGSDCCRLGSSRTAPPHLDKSKTAVPLLMAYICNLYIYTHMYICTCIYIYIYIYIYLCI